MKNTPQRVVLFSGGLDSLGGAIKEVIEDQSPVFLLTHESTPKLRRRRPDVAARPAGTPTHRPTANERRRAQRDRCALACEQGDIISNAAMGFVRNHPAAWRAVNAIEESFFERRYVGDQAGPGLVARIMLEHDDVVLFPPACFHPRVGETIRNLDLPRLLMQAHLFAGTWVEGRRGDHAGLWWANQVRSL